ncbi:MAG: hypothetical protein KY445_14260 [Armatimonadetes bacterium]|nr:hypothetical protein [Armatimonadota bacterium]
MPEHNSDKVNFLENPRTEDWLMWDFFGVVSLALLIYLGFLMLKGSKENVNR